MYLLAFSVINFCGFDEFMTSDMYSDTLIARYMWHEKTLFPHSWVFGNQYYIAATPVLAAFFYGICGSMNTAMALSSTAMTLLILLSLLYMLRPFCRRRHMAFAVLMLLSGVAFSSVRYSPEAQLFFLMASYYSCYLITAFTVFGDYVRTVKFGKSKAASGFLIGIFLSFCSGMQSLRQTAVMICPLIAFDALRLLFLYKKGNCKLFLPTLHVLAYTFSDILGRFYMIYLKIPSEKLYGTCAVTPPKAWVERFNASLRALLSIMGIGTGKLGFFWIFSFALSLCCFFLSVIYILKNKDFNGMECLIFLFALSVFITFLICIATDINVRSVYFFMWYPLSALSKAYAVIRFKGKLKYFLLFLLMIFCVLNFLLCFLPAAREAFGASEETPEMKAAVYLTENGYNMLYGHFWKVSLIAGITDGRVTAGTWNERMFEALSYISPMDIYGESDNENAVYLIENNNIEFAKAYASERGAFLVPVKYIDTFGLYTSTKQLMYLS